MHEHFANNTVATGEKNISHVVRTCFMSFKTIVRMTFKPFRNMFEPTL